jgi:hypothetical protein
MSKKIKVKKKKDANGISFKNRLKGHINWRKVRYNISGGFRGGVRGVRPP